MRSEERGAAGSASLGSKLPVDSVLRVRSASPRTPRSLGALALPQSCEKLEVTLLLGRDISVAHEEVDDDDGAVGFVVAALSNNLHDPLHGPQEELLHLPVLRLGREALGQLEVVHKHDVALEPPVGVDALVADGARGPSGGRQRRRDARLLPALLHDVLRRADPVRLPAGHDVVEHSRPRLLRPAPPSHPHGPGAVLPPHPPVDVHPVGLDAEQRGRCALDEERGLGRERRRDREELIPPAGDEPAVPQPCKHIGDGLRASFGRRQVAAELQARLRRLENIPVLHQMTCEGRQDETDGCAFDLERNISAPETSSIVAEIDNFRNPDTRLLAVLAAITKLLCRTCEAKSGLPEKNTPVVTPPVL
eukprot:CAMPEP_0177610726 /NCGR_PEP_ID=MMETSP0419_2-20121207/19967_1 /TAXON_ID=582737 /ORGANISM="Tetraselmis sp., Strain GSL018" /LENGTH=363 /DNA_ID=CAMNT_0019106119 /DNA_START=1275 /DNA_END=2367 /DNA_ORIENTATION=-